MKKYLLLALIGLFTFSVNAKCDSLVKTAPDSLQLTYKQVYNDIKSGISAIADNLKVGAEHVYTVLVRQQVVLSISFLVLAPIIILLLLSFSKNLKLSKWDSSYYRNENPNEWNKHATLTIITGILSIICTAILLANIHTIVTGIINPEYGAIHEILSIIK